MTNTATIAARALADGAGAEPSAGWISIRDGRIVARGSGSHGGASHAADLVIPGGLDSHVHGAVGIDFSVPGVDPAPAIRHHHGSGATTIVASMATGTMPQTLRRLVELKDVVRSGELAGVHLEGPWLSARRRGAHAEHLLRTPTPAQANELLKAGGGTVRMVTLAPELPGALETIRLLVEAGVVVAIGHTDSDADMVARAVDAGATSVTHLFNGMRPMEHRRPGVVGVALGRDDLFVELIADGAHLDDLVTSMVLRAAPRRTVLVSDAMAATGVGDGTHELAGSRVVVRDGVARVADGSSLAGGTTTLGDMIARMRAHDYSPNLIVGAATLNPAAALGLSVPALRVGDSADLIAFIGKRRHVMRKGVWLKP